MYLRIFNCTEIFYCIPLNKISNVTFYENNDIEHSEYIRLFHFIFFMAGTDSKWVKRTYLVNSEVPQNKSSGVFKISH